MFLIPWLAKFRATKAMFSRVAATSHPRSTNRPRRMFVAGQVGLLIVGQSAERLEERTLLSNFSLVAAAGTVTVDVTNIASPTTLTFTAAGAGNTTVSDGIFADTQTFANPTTSLVVNGINGAAAQADILEFTSFGSGFAAALSVTNSSAGSSVDLGTLSNPSSITVSAPTITVSGPVAAGTGGTIDLTATGAISEIGGTLTTTGELITSSGTGTTLGAANSVGSFSATDNSALGIHLTDSPSVLTALALATVAESGTGAVAITNTNGDITVVGVVSSGIGGVSLNAAGAISESTGLINTTGTLTTASTGGTTLLAANTVSGFNATDSSAVGVSLSNTTTTLTITGVAQTGGGTLTVLNVGAIDVSGAIDPVGDIAITGTTAVTINAPITTVGAVTITGTGDTGAHTGTVITLNAPVTGSTVVVNGGAYNDTINVNLSGATLMTLDGKGGNNTYNILLGSLIGAVTISDSGGGVAAAVLTGPATGSTFNIGPLQTVIPGATPQTVNYTASLTSLTVNGGVGSDTFNVTPSATTTDFINGGLPTPPALPGDTLAVNLLGTTNAVETLILPTPASGYAGTWTFGNAQPVTFSEMETLSNTNATVSITPSVTTIAEGQNVVYTFSVHNPGPALANVTLSDLLQASASATPAGVSYVSSAFSQGTTSLTGNTLTASLGTIAAGATVTGTVTVNALEEGDLLNTVTVSSPVMPVSTKNADVTVTDPAVVGTPINVTAVEGSSTGVIAVASFSDPGNPNGTEAPPASYSATIDWGDASTPSTGIIVAQSGGMYLVTGSHTYATDSAGTPFAMTVTINHEAAPATVISGGTATVADPAVVVTGGLNLAAVEGQAFTNQAVATFADPGGAESVGSYTASVNWGDGTPASSGTITYSATTQIFTVAGGHTYAEQGTFPISVSLTHGTAPAATATSNAMVSDPPVVATGAFTLNAIATQASTSQTVATFTDPGGPEAVGDYTASIAWGDGTSSAGTITLNAATSVFTVAGGHTYALGGTFAITVTLNHDVAPTAPPVTATSAAAVADLLRMTRSYNEQADQHFFTTSLFEFQTAQLVHLTNETTGIPGFDVTDSSTLGETPIYRLYNPVGGQHYLTTNASEKTGLMSEGWNLEHNEGFLFSTQYPGTVQVFTLYNTKTGDHVYTPNAAEESSLVQTYPGVWVQTTSLGYGFADAGTSSLSAASATELAALPVAAPSAGAAGGGLTANAAVALDNSTQLAAATASSGSRQAAETAATPVAVPTQSAAAVAALDTVFSNPRDNLLLGLND